MTDFDRQRRDIERLTNAAATAAEGWVTENQLALSGCTLAAETRLAVRAAIAHLISEQLIVAAPESCFDDVSGYLHPVHTADLDAALERELEMQDRIDRALEEPPAPVDARRAFQCDPGC